VTISTRNDSAGRGAIEAAAFRVAVLAGFGRVFGTDGLLFSGFGDVDLRDLGEPDSFFFDAIRYAAVRDEVQNFNSTTAASSDVGKRRGT
jgi:hypothetical protein